MRALVLVAVLLAPAGAAHARPGVTLGLRAGGGVPYGRTASVAALSDELRFALPITAEVTLAASPRLSVGPFLQYGAGALSQSAPLGSGACADTASRCADGRVLRIGAQLIWILDDRGRVTTWAAVGTAYESLRLLRARPQRLGHRHVPRLGVAERAARRARAPARARPLRPVRVRLDWSVRAGAAGVRRRVDERRDRRQDHSRLAATRGPRDLRPVVAPPEEPIRRRASPLLPDTDPVHVHPGRARRARAVPAGRDVPRPARVRDLAGEQDVLAPVRRSPRPSSRPAGRRCRTCTPSRSTAPRTCATLPGSVRCRGATRPSARSGARTRTRSQFRFIADMSRSAVQP